jgi:hypothetical protein
VPGHRLEARIDAALLALADLVDRGLHVVVDAPAGHATEEGERPCVGIEQHLVRLAVVGHQTEGATGRQLGVCHLQAAAQTADEEVLAAPVELERLAQLEAQRHEPCTTRRVALLLLPALGKGIDRPSAAAVALRPQRFKHRLDPAPVTFAAMAIGLEPLAQLFLVRIQDAGA